MVVMAIFAGYLAEAVPNHLAHMLIACLTLYLE